MKNTTMAVMLFFVATLVGSFFLDAAIIWALCLALNAAGIATIGGFAVAFSWPLAVTVWLISVLISVTVR